SIIRIVNDEQRVVESLFVSGDKFGIVEVVDGIHFHWLVEAPAHVDLALLVEQRDLDAIDLRRVGVDNGNSRVHRLVEIGGAPIACKLWSGHGAEAVDAYGLNGV